MQRMIVAVFLAWAVLTGTAVGCGQGDPAVEGVPPKLQFATEALGGWYLLRSSKPLFGRGCSVEGGFDSHALPPSLQATA